MCHFIRYWILVFWLSLISSHVGATGATGDATGAAVPIYLYTSPTTENYFRQQKQFYSAIPQRWRQFLKRYSPHVREIGRDELLTGVPTGVLILPTAVALDTQEKTAIETFAAKGGSLFGNGQIGSRDEQGRDTGLDFLHRTFRVRTHGFFAASDDTFVMPFGDGPITWTIPAGRRMPITVVPESVLRIEAENAAAVLMDWSRSIPTQPYDVMAFDETATHRVAYFSFPDTAWSLKADVALLLTATIDWLRREPHAHKAAWPNGYVASHLIEMDTEDKFFSAPSFAKHLESEGFKGTFYCVTSLAAVLPNVVRDLIERGHEIAYHADVHFGFKNVTPGEQELRIRFMTQQMGAVLGARAHEATGFRAPTESYDKTTEMLLRKYGVLHHAADESAHDDRLPFFSLSEPGLPPDKALVVLPRSQLDDVSFMHLKYTPEQVTATLNHDLALMVRSGSFSLLSVHSQNYIDGGLMMLTMGDYVRKVATYRDRLWVARGDEITQWWRQRETVQLSQNLRDGAVFVTLESAVSVPGLTVFVTLPKKNATVSVLTKPHNTAVRIKPIDAYRVALIFEQLPPGKTQAKIKFQ